MQQQPIGLGGNRVGDLWSKSKQRLQAGHTIDSHSKIDDDEVWIL
jgi:hypothetical protein